MFDLILTTYAVSLDCPNVIQFASNLEMQNKQAAIWSQLQVNCCNTTGITCDGSERVSQIVWSGKELDGTINETAIPSNVTWLGLSDNLFTGSMPSSLPSLLTTLYLHNNRLTGPIPTSLPIGLSVMYVHGNKLSGDLPSFPPNLQLNQFTSNLYTTF